MLMSIKDDVARLKRLGNSNSPQWRKTQHAIDRVVRQLLIPGFLNRNKSENPGWYDLPRGYELKYYPLSDLYQLRKWNGNTIVFTTNGYFFTTRVMIEFAHDLSTGWLDEVEELAKQRFGASSPQFL